MIKTDVGTSGMDKKASAVAAQKKPQRGSKTMRDIVTALAEKFRGEHRAARRYVALVLALSMVVTLFVNW